MAKPCSFVYKDRKTSLGCTNITSLLDCWLEQLKGVLVMRNSRAPYECVPRHIARARPAQDRQTYRLVGRMWARQNEREDAPILRIWKTVEAGDAQLWLSFGPYGIDEWFIRAVNASVWDISTNTGANLVEKLHKHFVVEPSVDEIRAWFEENDSKRVSHVTHECSPACFERKYYLNAGYGKHCVIVPMPPEVELTFYATMAWLCTGEGRCFVARYNVSVRRIYRLPMVQKKNREFKDGLIRQRT